MKKYLPGALAFLIAISLSAFQSFTTVKKHSGQHPYTTFNWYPVGSNNRISSTTAVYNDMAKIDVVTSDNCKDQVLPNCLFGTNGTVTLNQDISGQPAAQRVRQHN